MRLLILTNNIDMVTGIIIYLSIVKVLIEKYNYDILIA